MRSSLPLVAAAARCVELMMLRGSCWIMKLLLPVTVTIVFLFWWLYGNQNCHPVFQKPILGGLFNVGESATCSEKWTGSMVKVKNKGVADRDFTGWSVTGSVPIKTTRDTINILQNHCPERLGIALLYNPPCIFESFWKIVRYFFDAKTIQKVKFVYPKYTESVQVIMTYFEA